MGTHGVPSVLNSHPHKVGKFTVVHKGIIENYASIKEKINKESYRVCFEYRYGSDTCFVGLLLQTR